jgi:hypothetical protein
MRRAFVVQLRKPGPDVAGPLEGSIEEVDTGKQCHFHSPDELIVFLRERFAQACPGVTGSEGAK